MYLGRKSSWLKHLDFILIDLATFMFTYIIAVLICHGQFNYNDETVRIGLIFFCAIRFINCILFSII